MDPRLQRRVQRYGWDRAVEAYDDSWKRQLEPAQSRLLEMADLQRGENVLDVACGTGLVTLRAAAAVGAGGSVIGTDISSGMIDSARELARREAVTHVRYERGGAETLEFDDGTFDAVLCGLGMMYVPSPHDAFREFLRVLRSGGRASVAVWGARAACGWAEIFPIVDARVQSEVCPAFFQLGTGDTLRLVMEASGFGGVTVDRLRTTLHYPTDEAALIAAFAGGPVALAYSRFDERTLEEAHAEYLASIEPYRDDGKGFAIPGEFVVACGVKA